MRLAILTMTIALTSVPCLADGPAQVCVTLAPDPGTAATARRDCGFVQFGGTIVDPNNPPLCKNGQTGWYSINLAALNSAGTSIRDVNGVPQMDPFRALEWQKLEKALSTLRPVFYVSTGNYRCGYPEITGITEGTPGP